MQVVVGGTLLTDVKLDKGIIAVTEMRGYIIYNIVIYISQQG